MECLFLVLYASMIRNACESQIGAKLDRTGAGPEAPPSDAPQILVDVDASCLDEFLSQLKRYSNSTMYKVMIIVLL